MRRVPWKRKQGSKPPVALITVSIVKRAVGPSHTSLAAREARWRNHSASTKRKMKCYEDVRLAENKNKIYS